MSPSKFEFVKLISLLGRSENDPDIKNFFGNAMSNIERDEYYGSLEFKPEGVDVVFNESPWVLPSEQIIDPKELYLSAFHLHSDGHEGYAGYRGKLPNGVMFGDSEAEVLRKMGRPLKTGGGGMSRVTTGLVPRWLWFPLGDAILHIQLDANDRVDVVTPQIRQV